MSKEQEKKPFNLLFILKISAIFIASYLIFLFIWVNIKDYYGFTIANHCASIASYVKNVTHNDIRKDGDTLIITFMPLKYGSSLLMGTIVKTSTYTFNAPLTFAIMAAFFLFLRKKSLYLEVLLFLIISHYIYVFAAVGNQLTTMLVGKGFEEGTNMRLFYWQFLWGFMDNMVIRFEPFLIGAYLYFRNMMSNASGRKDKKAPNINQKNERRLSIYFV